MSFLKLKLKSIGNKMKTKKIKSLDKKRLELINLAKKTVSKYGWNDSLFEKISFNNRINPEELFILFPDGYKQMLKLSLDYLNYELENICNQYDFKRIPVHKRIKKIIIIKINLMKKNKDFYRRTFYFLLLPINYKLLTAYLYKSVDLMWYLSGDNSTDFNFYTKRMILSGVYSSVILHFISNDSLLETEKKLDNNLLKVSKIPLIKDKIKLYKKSLPSFLRFLKSYSF